MSTSSVTWSSVSSLTPPSWSYINDVLPRSVDEHQSTSTSSAAAAATVECSDSEYDTIGSADSQPGISGFISKLYFIDHTGGAYSASLQPLPVLEGHFATQRVAREEEKECKERGGATGRIADSALVVEG